MSKASDTLLLILSGGLPAVLDDPAAATQPVEVDAPDRVEETPPEPTNRDREPFLQTVSQNQILIGTAGVLGILALIMLVRR